METVRMDANEVTPTTASSITGSCNDLPSSTTISLANTDEHDSYRIALYYCYIPFDENDITTLVTFHSTFQNTLGGRIRIASEGLNGVLSGKRIDLIQYESQLRTVLSHIIESKNNIIHLPVVGDILNDTGNPSTVLEWELDVKYCCLRTDLSIDSQLFTQWQVQITDTVVGLFDKDILRNEENNNGNDVATTCIFDPSIHNDISLQPCRRSRRHQPKQQRNDPRQQNHLEAIRTIYESSFQNKIGCPLAVSAPHLSPDEWNNKLEQLVSQQQQLQHESLPKTQNQKPNGIVLLDCRNYYESAIGYFEVPGVTTILSNTRKYSELPLVLMNEISNENQASALRNASHIFMYCTGGVRCERASAFLRAAFTSTRHDNETEYDVDENNMQQLDEKDISSIASKQQMPEIYQLHGGIQRYLEQYHDTKSIYIEDENENTDPPKESLTLHYYRGKNFVFDLRRTDPMTFSTNDANNTNIVGRCIICSIPHDDYDHGHAPVSHKETRCYKCRILILVCKNCRSDVLCWGDNNNDVDTNNHPISYDNDTTTPSSMFKRRLYCGGLEPKECLNIPPVKEISLKGAKIE